MTKLQEQRLEAVQHLIEERTERALYPTHDDRERVVRASVPTVAIARAAANRRREARLS